MDCVVLSDGLCKALQNGCRGLNAAVTVLLLMIAHLQGSVAERVYFNSYGDCVKGQYSLSEETYSLWATGAQEYHETLICQLTFRAPPGTGVCLNFQEFAIRDCSVNLLLYQESTASGKQWKRLTCDDYEPGQMCTPERYVTLKLAKRNLNKNKGYQFKILVDKSSNLKGEDVILASSIGLFVGIIAGVVGLVVILAVFVLCCCCKPYKSQKMQQTKKADGGPPVAGTTSQPAMPTAPPVMEIEDECTPLHGGPGAPLYPPLPQPYQSGFGIPAEQPPPYAPPPYEQHLFPTKPEDPSSSERPGTTD